MVAEGESAALSAWAQAHDGQVLSSDLLRTELLRATRREAPEEVPRARALLDSVTLVNLTPSTFERAGAVAPDLLRSLDALHLAAALELGDDLDGLVTYDDHLADAAAVHGVAVVAPR